jgi:restriction system protein
MRSDWEKCIQHEGLKAFRVVRGATPEEVNVKAASQLATWEARWSRVQAAERTREQTSEFREEVVSIETLLERALTQDYRRDWNALKRFDQFTEPRPTKPKPKVAPQTEPPVPISPDFFELTPTFMHRLFPFLRSRKQAELDQRRQAALTYLREKNSEVGEFNAREQERVAGENREEESGYQAKLDSWRARKAEFESEREQHNRTLEEERERYSQGDTNALLTYWNDLFCDQAYPESWPEVCWFSVKWREGALR